MKLCLSEGFQVLFDPGVGIQIPFQPEHQVGLLDHYPSFLLPNKHPKSSRNLEHNQIL
jgi:hypothetical protein